MDADLYRAWLMGAALHGVDLSRADLRKAQARGCDAQDAVLYGADLRKAEFDGADLRRADLRKSLLADAWLSRADLRGADLRGCTFGGDKSWTSLGDTRMAGCRLDGATGRVTGPVDVGADSARRLDGSDLQHWLGDGSVCRLRPASQRCLGRPWTIRHV